MQLPNKVTNFKRKKKAHISVSLSHPNTYYGKVAILGFGYEQFRSWGEINDALFALSNGEFYAARRRKAGGLVAALLGSRNSLLQKQKQTQGQPIPGARGRQLSEQKDQQAVPAFIASPGQIFQWRQHGQCHPDWLGPGTLNVTRLDRPAGEPVRQLFSGVETDENVEIL